jgi:Lipid A 3-O-deacylase (PagL)
MEVSSGFGKTQLDRKGDYILIPVIFDFDFDLKPFFNKKNVYPPGLFQFQIEPFVNLVTQPAMNMEIGNVFTLKFGILPESNRFQPYLKGGVGFVYMTQSTYEQSTLLNFLEQIGIGARYLLAKNKALTMEGFYRHVSNASISQPNAGISPLFLTLGFAYQF